MPHGCRDGRSLLARPARSSRAYRSRSSLTRRHCQLRRAILPGASSRRRGRSVRRMEPDANSRDQSRVYRGKEGVDGSSPSECLKRPANLWIRVVCAESRVKREVTRSGAMPRLQAFPQASDSGLRPPIASRGRSWVAPPFSTRRVLRIRSSQDLAASNTYTVRSASVGESCAARIAGRSPAIAPIRMAAARPPAQAIVGTTAVQCLVEA